MDSEHRKVELQAPADLTHLASKIRTLAREKLDLHLPSQSNTTEPDELRKQVESLVEAFVAQILSSMKHNISINGIDIVARGEAMDIDDGLQNGIAEVEEFEPFDEKLRAQLASAVQKRDALISKISAHRRNTPALAARNFEEQYSQDGVSLESARIEAEKVGLKNAEKEVVGVEILKRQAEVERSWERAVEGLARLNKGLPETRARLERCGDVVAYLGPDKKKARV